MCRGSKDDSEAVLRPAVLLAARELGQEHLLAVVTCTPQLEGLGAHTRTMQALYGWGGFDSHTRKAGMAYDVRQGV